MQNFKYLGKRSLDRIWGWCERNEGTPLAEMYLNGCACIGGFDAINVADQIESTYVKPKKHRLKYVRKANRLQDNAFIYRDSIGRVILEIIKRESARGEGKP